MQQNSATTCTAVSSCRASKHVKNQNRRHLHEQLSFVKVTARHTVMPHMLRPGSLKPDTSAAGPAVS
jgi:hypothetical protein